MHPLSRGSRSWLGCGLVLAVAVGVLGIAPAAARACPSLAGIRAFRGKGSASFSASASGEDPGNGGVETVTLDRSNQNQRLRLAGKVKGKTLHVGGKTIKPPVVFLGGASGGEITIGDTFSNTGSGFTGSLSAAGPLKLPGAGAAAIVLYPQVCAYQLEFSFDEKTAFHGQVPIPSGNGAGGGVITPRRHIPGSLKLSGGAAVGAYYSGCSGAERPDEMGCYQFSAGWATDFQTLKLCNSVVAVGCGRDDEEEGTAHVSWSLTPSFKKKHKHA
jgi:hypothetical protein